MSVILIVDDDEDVGQTLEISLAQSGHHAMCVANGHEAFEQVRREKPDLVVLDIAMPDIDGIEICRRLRANPSTSSTPILFVTASADIQSKIASYDAGADDYLVKPFNLQELELRVQALLRRANGNHDRPKAMTLGSLSLDSQTYDVTLDQKRILLTPVEFELLHFLMSRPRQVFTTQRLLRDVWQYPPGTGSPEVVRAHIKNLRNKIEPDPRHPSYLITVGRFGYALRPHEPLAT